MAKIILTEVQLRKLVALLSEDVVSDQTGTTAQTSTVNNNMTQQNQTVNGNGVQTAATISQQMQPNQLTAQTPTTQQAAPLNQQTINGTQATTGNEQSEVSPTQTVRVKNRRKYVLNLKNEYQGGKISEDNVIQALTALGFVRDSFLKLLNSIVNPFGNTNTAGASGSAGGAGIAMFGERPPGNFTPAADWKDAYTKMGKWYEANIHTYQGRPGNKRGRLKYECNLIGGGDVCDDCSAFVKACLQLFKKVPGIDDIGVTTASMQPGGAFDKALLASGFKRYGYDRNTICEGDIICGGPKTHTEIYAGNGESYSWGSVHDGKDYGHQGMPCRLANTQFIWVWRYEGNGNQNQEK